VLRFLSYFRGSGHLLLSIFDLAFLNLLEANFTKWTRIFSLGPLADAVVAEEMVATVDLPPTVRRAKLFETYRTARLLLRVLLSLIFPLDSKMHFKRLSGEQSSHNHVVILKIFLLVLFHHVARRSLVLFKKIEN